MVWKVQSAQKLPTLFFSVAEKTKFRCHIGSCYSSTQLLEDFSLEKVISNIICIYTQNGPQLSLRFRTRSFWLKFHCWEEVQEDRTFPLLGVGAEEGGPILTLWLSFLCWQNLEVQCCVRYWHRSTWRSGWAWLSLMSGGNARSCFWRHCILRGHLLW